MGFYLDTFSKIVEAGIIGHLQNFRIYSRKQASSSKTKLPGYSPYVYVLFLGNDVSYVGITRYLPTRIGQHSRSKINFDSVMAIVLDQHGISDWRASDIERKCIGLLRPKNNKLDNPDYDKRTA